MNDLFYGQNKFFPLCEPEFSNITLAAVWAGLRELKHKAFHKSLSYPLPSMW